MEKEDVVYVHNGIVFSHKKEWNNDICNNINGSRDYHITWTKSEREIQISYDITYTWNIKDNTK